VARRRRAARHLASVDATPLVPHSRTMVGSQSRLATFLGLAVVALVAGSFALAEAKQTDGASAPSLSPVSAMVLLDGSAAAPAEAKYPHTAKSVLSASSESTIHFVVTMDSSEAKFQPHQFFVRISPTFSRPVGPTGWAPASSLTLVASPDAAVQNQWRASLSMSDRAALSGIVGGHYSVELVVGDSALAKPLRWKFAEVELYPPPPPVPKEEILYTKPLLHESDIAMAPLKEIVHQFRPDDRRPPVVVSLAFAGAIVAVVIVTIGRAGAIAAEAPARAHVGSGSAFVFALALTAVPVLLAAYFFAWFNLFGLVLYGSALLIALAFVFKSQFGVASANERSE
jgi:hypothetical protein